MMNGLQKPTTKYLYKYGSLSVLDRLRQILLEDTIYYPTSSQLNDPTESLPVLVDPSLDELIDSLCEQFKMKNPSASTELMEKIRVNGISLGKDKLIEIFRYKHQERIIDRYGILSLSQLDNSPILWAYYANKHTGYLLKFLNLKDFSGGYKVQYKKKVPFQFTSGIGSSQVDFLYTKDPDWEKEEEIRIVSLTPGPKSFAPDLLVSVILGKDIKPTEKGLILDWVENRTIPINVLQASFNSSTQKIEYHPL